MMAALALIAGVILGAIAIIVAAEMAVLSDDASDNPPPSLITLGDEP